MKNPLLEPKRQRELWYTNREYQHSFAASKSLIQRPQVCRSNRNSVGILGMDVPTVLVVDDELAITEFVLDALSDEGYDVRVCHDGASALLEIQNDRPDLVLLDISLPVMTGEEVLNRVRGNGGSAAVNLPIIVMTARPRAQQFLEYGANAVLEKPFTVVNLIETIARYTPV